MSSKVRIRMEQIARLRVGGMKDAQIAALVGLTPAGVARIVGTPEYRELQETILTVHLANLDKALAREDFTVAVRAAFNTLLEATTQRKDLKAAVSAAKEILDRDPARTLTKDPQIESSVALPDCFPADVFAELEKIAAEMEPGSCESVHSEK